jgi:hypothetical protein
MLRVPAGEVVTRRKRGPFHGPLVNVILTGRIDLRVCSSSLFSPRGPASKAFLFDEPEHVVVDRLQE